MQRTASAHWSGGLKDGKGTVSTQSGVLSQTQYSFSTRFENGAGTNPEELIAAAHAGCFSMALSAQLGSAGLTAESIDTKATLTRSEERRVGSDWSSDVCSSDLSGGTDCRSACRLFFHGTVRTAWKRGPDGGEHRYQGDFDLGQNRGWLYHYQRTPRRKGQDPWSGPGEVRRGRPKCQEGMPCFPGSQCQHHHGRATGFLILLTAARVEPGSQPSSAELPRKRKTCEPTSCVPRPNIWLPG